MGIAFLLFLPYAGGGPNSTPLLWIVFILFWFTMAELCLSPVGQSLSTKLAPHAFHTQMIALFFLSIAAGRGFVVDSYEDHAAGTLARDASGRLAMTRVVLRPVVAFSGARLPDAREIQAMHDEAHHECFLANSVKTEVVVEPGSRS